MPSKKQTPKAFAATGLARIQAATGEGESEKLPTFSGNAYTGIPMKPEGYIVPIICDLNGFELPSQTQPVLRQHNHNEIAGHTNSIEITSQGVMIAGVFSGEKQHTDKVTVPAKNGFPWQLSIGADPKETSFLEAGETATVNGQEVTGPMVISHRTLLGEISFVPLGADGQTSATVTATRGKIMNFKAALKTINAGKYSTDQVDAMSEEEAKAALKECMKAEGEPDGDEAKAKAADDAKDEDEGKKAEASAKRAIDANRKLYADESRRVASIQAAAREHGVSVLTVNGKEVNFEAHAIEAGWTVDKAKYEAIKAGRPGAGVGSPNFYSPSTPQVTEQVLEAAVLQAARHEFRLGDDDFYQDTNGERTTRRISARIQKDTQRQLKARYDDKTEQAAHDLFKGRIGLQQVLVEAARSNGYRGGDNIRDGGDIERVFRASNWNTETPSIRADGASTASIANVLANVQNKFLLQGYLFVEQAWREVSGIRPVKDFKPTKTINLFGDFKFDAVSESGELKNANLQDQAFANQADQYGKIMTIGRKSIINDDLGALTTVPMLMGRGSALKLNDLFWTTWLDTNQKDDGGSTAFWAATHTIANQKANGNYISGATTALSSTSLQTAKQTFDKQIDPNGYPLGIEAEILLYSVENDKTAWELCNSQQIVMAGLASTSSGTLQPSGNRWVGKYKPVMSRYLSNANFTGYSTTAWYLLANPGIMPTIEACFLNGVDVPTVQQAGPDYQFNNLGISIRGVFDFGVTVQNFRGGVKSAGA